MVQVVTYQVFEPLLELLAVVALGNAVLYPPALSEIWDLSPIFVGICWSREGWGCAGVSCGGGSCSSVLLVRLMSMHGGGGCEAVWGTVIKSQWERARCYSVERLDISGMSGGMFKAVGNHGIFI
jgi:hypothetical protein